VAGAGFNGSDKSALGSSPIATAMRTITTAGADQVD